MNFKNMDAKNAGLGSRDFKKQIAEAIGKAVGELTGGQEVEVKLEHPSVEAHGDYSANIAMAMFGISNFQFPISKKFSNPEELAESIKGKLEGNKGLEGLVEKIDVVAPGFINFWLSKEMLVEELKKSIQEGKKYGAGEKKKEKVVLEHTSPNTNKPLHLGHIRNNVLAMSVAHLLQMSGYEVAPVEIINDRGVHICKSMMGYLYFGLKDQDNKSLGNLNWRELIKRWTEKPDLWLTPQEAKIKSDHFVGKYYVESVKREETDVDYKTWIQEMLLAWEQQDEATRKLWKKMNNWFYEGVEVTYKALGSIPSQRWYESEIYQEGKEIVQQNLGRLFEKREDGSVVAKLAKYGLEEKVVLRKDGTSVYITQDLALLRDRKAQIDGGVYIYVVAQEQALHFKQLFAMAQELGIAKEDELYHLGYGLVRFTSGAMSSREGNVINADDLLDEMKATAQRFVEDAQIKKNLTAEDRDLSEKIGTGALKYAILRYSPTQDIVFDIEKSISFEGDSGPYLQYTYARTQSVLEKAESGTPQNFAAESLNPEESYLLRNIYRFGEVIESATENYAPNIVCNYLNELAQAYNAFYNQHRILPSGVILNVGEGSPAHAASDKQRDSSPRPGGAQNGRDKVAFRLALTESVGNILKTGLGLLGIEAPERM